MKKEQKRTVSDAIRGTLDGEAFLAAVFDSCQGAPAAADAIDLVLLDPLTEISRGLDETNLQQSCSVRNVIRTRKLAEQLITDRGELATAQLDRAIYVLQKNLYWIGPGREHDARRQEHLLACLMRLQKDANVRKALIRVQRPDRLPKGEELIRATLQLPTTAHITDAHARRAALAAWLCYLRQNVGSCFATAPAIIVQSEQPVQFFEDINRLLGTGRLERVIAGNAYVAPLTKSWGIGDLRRPLIIGATPEECPVAIWNSPGLQQALHAAGIPSEPNQIREKIFVALPSGGAGWITIDELLGLLLRHEHGVKDSDLDNYYRSQEILVLPGSIGASTPVGNQKTERYLEALEKARVAFKTLTDNPLLKAWEFSLASFAETKPNFARWNLYTSLGFDHTEPNGIGASLYEGVQERLNVLNEEVSRLTTQLEGLQAQVEYTGQRMRRATSEQEMKFMQAEYQMRVGEFRHIETQRDIVYNKSHVLAGLHKRLLDKLDEQLQGYFQEVYDPDMHEVTTGPYDDAPAGFRLLCKHGRTHASQWTLIYTPHQFAEALAGFFVSVEHEMSYDEELKVVKDEVGPIITRLVGHVKSLPFLESALHRMAKAHGGPILKDPLQHLDRLPKKPWSYTSGGTMASLVACYFGRAEHPTEASRWVENPLELLTFLVDTLRRSRGVAQGLLDVNRGRRLLMTSPTHAFTMKPGNVPFHEAWLDNDAYSYTWIRDNWIKPKQLFFSQILLERDAIQALILELRSVVPHSLHAAFDRAFSVPPVRSTIQDIRHTLVVNLKQERELQHYADSVLDSGQIDSLIYENIPYTSGSQLRRNVERIFSLLPEQTQADVERLMGVYDEWREVLTPPSTLSSKSLRALCKALMISDRGAVTSPRDLHQHIFEVCGQLGLAVPSPVRFADSNWVTEDFAFVVNPATQQLEFWRTDYCGSTGAPMAIWNQWLDGSRKDREWSVYTQPHEYVAGFEK